MLRLGMLKAGFKDCAGIRLRRLPSLQKAIELQGTLVLARYECGMILAEMGELERPLSALNKCW
jgi:hypothetical protein